MPPKLTTKSKSKSRKRSTSADADDSDASNTAKHEDSKTIKGELQIQRPYIKNIDKLYGHDPKLAAIAKVLPLDKFEPSVPKKYPFFEIDELWYPRDEDIPASGYWHTGPITWMNDPKGNRDKNGKILQVPVKDETSMFAWSSFTAKRGLQHAMPLTMKMRHQEHVSSEKIKKELAMRGNLATTCAGLIENLTSDKDKLEKDPTFKWQDLSPRRWLALIELAYAILDYDKDHDLLKPGSGVGTRKNTNQKPLRRENEEKRAAKEAAMGEGSATKLKPSKKSKPRASGSGTANADPEDHEPDDEDAMDFGDDDGDDSDGDDSDPGSSDDGASLSDLDGSRDDSEPDDNDHGRRAEKALLDMKDQVKMALKGLRYLNRNEDYRKGAVGNEDEEIHDAQRMLRDGMLLLDQSASTVWAHMYSERPMRTAREITSGESGNRVLSGSRNPLMVEVDGRACGAEWPDRYGPSRVQGTDAIIPNFTGVRMPNKTDLFYVTTDLWRGIPVMHDGVAKFLDKDSEKKKWSLEDKDEFNKEWKHGQQQKDLNQYGREGWQKGRLAAEMHRRNLTDNPLLTGVIPGDKNRAVHYACVQDHEEALRATIHLTNYEMEGGFRRFGPRYIRAIFERSRELVAKFKARDGGLSGRPENDFRYPKRSNYPSDEPVGKSVRPDDPPGYNEDDSKASPPRHMASQDGRYMEDNGFEPYKYTPGYHENLPLANLNTDIHPYHDQVNEFDDEEDRTSHEDSVDENGVDKEFTALAPTPKFNRTAVKKYLEQRKTEWEARRQVQGQTQDQDEGDGADDNQEADSSMVDDEPDTPQGLRLPVDADTEMQQDADADVQDGGDNTQMDVDPQPPSASQASASTQTQAVAAARAGDKHGLSPISTAKQPGAKRAKPRTSRKP